MSWPRSTSSTSRSDQASLRTIQQTPRIYALLSGLSDQVSVDTGNGSEEVTIAASNAVTDSVSGPELVDESASRHLHRLPQWRSPTADLTVDYATADGTATAGSDCEDTSSTRTFTDRETSKTVTVTTNGDSNYESDEAFSFSLSTVSDGGSPSELGQISVTTTIIDNDSSGGLVSIDLSIDGTASLSESRNAKPFTVKATLNGGPLEQDISFYISIYGSAKNPVDYTVGETWNPKVTIPASDSSVSRNITITSVDDD